MVEKAITRAFHRCMGRNWPFLAGNIVAPLAFNSLICPTFCDMSRHDRKTAASDDMSCHDINNIVLDHTTQKQASLNATSHSTERLFALDSS